MEVKVYTDIETCKRLWEQNWPVRNLFDLWQVRECFHAWFNRPLRFYTVEEKGKVTGFLPMCLCEESGQYVFFPGETWHGKTWIEQNQVVAKNTGVLNCLFDALPENTSLRYLNHAPLLERWGRADVDEIGYLFYPGIYDYTFENYWLGFSGKSRKKIRNEISLLEKNGVNYRFNHSDDLEHMFRLNTGSFEHQSYFHDPRFYGAFRDLASFLSEMGMLRITTVLIGGEVAAVDMGALFNDTYTLLAGGTDPNFRGVAKLINLHHLEYACRKQIDTVDFLCGDFNWKKRFRLSSRPLYIINHEAGSIAAPQVIHEERVCA